jgi:predicted acylesterase/phospholipase RssA
MMTSKLVLSALSLLLFACSHARPEALADCRLRAIPMYVGTTHPREIAAPGTAPAVVKPPPSPLQQFMTNILVQAPRDPAEAQRPSEVLVLSGGSQHGLFGTGFFLGRPSVPTYRMVTGVSTGSLQSTMFFLANQPVAPDRVYPEDRGFDPGAIPIRHSNLEDFAASSLISSEKSILKVGGGGILGGLASGSVTSLEPLKGRIYGLISPQTLVHIGREREHGRILLVGVTDLDDGNGYAIDLTELASRVKPDSAPAEVDAIRHCYVDTLIASSSVPLAAYPVSLNIKVVPTGEVRTDLFVDGGARYGVFLKQVEDSIQAANLARSNMPAPPPPTNVTLIVNGVMYSKPWTEKNVRPEKWSALSLGFRSIDILENQVYRFSIDQVETAALSGGTLKMAFISNEGLPAGAEDPGQHSYKGRTCTDWSAEDDRAHVAEFHPHYMACLLDYGKARGEHELWNVNRTSDASGSGGGTP